MKLSRIILTIALATCSLGAGLPAIAAGAADKVLATSGASSHSDGPSTESRAASASLDQVKAAFEARFKGLDVAAVRATPVPGLFEVQIGMDLLYVDAAVDYVFQGSLLDAKTRVDLTAARLQQISEVPFNSLPLDLAIKIVRGDGSRKLAVFEDPNCTYCKQLHASLSQIDNITLYSFQFPILSPDSVEKSRNIWCADDPSKTLQDWMLNAKVPAAAQCDDNPVEQVLELGRDLRVRGTPAILFADGSRVNGALPVEQLSQKLDTLSQ